MYHRIQYTPSEAKERGLEIKKGFLSKLQMFRGEFTRRRGGEPGGPRGESGAIL